MAAPANAAQATATHSFDIPARTLEQALLLFADQAGVQVAMQARDVRGLHSQPISGSYSSADALRRIVNDAPVQVRWTGVNTVSVRAAPMVRRAAWQPAAEAPQASAPVVEDPATEMGGLKEIVVTSQKRAQSLQTVPVAVTALSSTDLTGGNIDGQLALPRITPSLSLTSSSANVAAYIRGIGSQFANAGLEGSVSVYFDDMYMPRANSTLFNFNDVERVEVLKGPQGTLYGRNATGGAIRIITRDPTDRFEGAAAVTYGTHNRLAVEGMLNLPLGDGLAVRVAARHDENDGFIKNIVPSGRKRLETRNEEFYRAKILAEPTDNLTFKLSADYLDKNDTDSSARINLYTRAPEQLGAARGGAISTRFHEIASDYPDTILHLKSWGLSLRSELDAGDVVFASITSYRDQKQKSATDLDSTGAPLQNGTQYLRTKLFTQELQAVSSGSGPWSYVAGLYFLDEKAHQNFGVFGGSIGPGVYMGGDGQVHTESFAPYAQVDYELTDQLTITGGARYTWETKTLDYNRGYVGAAPTVGELYPTDVVYAPLGMCTAPGQIRCEAEPGKVGFREFTPKLTLSYEPIDRVLLYATYSKGFKSGGFNLPAFGFVDRLVPETLNAFELGWKLESGLVRFNGAGFYYKIKDLQQQITNQATGGTRAVNAAKATIWGLEGDVTWAALPDRLDLGAGVTYLNGEYDEYFGDAYVPCAQAPADGGCIARGGAGLGLLTGQDFSGNTVVNSPRWSGYVRGEFTQPLAGDGGTIDRPPPSGPGCVLVDYAHRRHCRVEV